MKKIYLLGLSLLIGSIITFALTAPANSSQRHPSKIVKNFDASSENMGESKTILLHSNGGKGITPSSSLNTLESTQSAGLGCVFSDNFNGLNDTASLHARGYLTYYRGGGPPGTSPTWFQGNPSLFKAYNGPWDGYVASNFNSVTGANPIDNWLVLPSLVIDSADVISFYSTSPLGSSFADSLHVWYSAAGDSLPEDTTWVLLGEFVVNIIGVWENKGFVIPEASTSGRLAIRYAVVDGGPDGLNSNFVGIDELVVYTPSAIDASMHALTSPKTGCVLTASESVTVIVKNTGTAPINSLDVSYTLDAGTPVVENISDIIVPGDEYSYTFGTLADLSGIGAHTIEASIVIPDDTNFCNDMNSFEIQNYTTSDPLDSAYVMGFETNENFATWVVEDGDGDGVSWEIIDTLTHSGSFCMRKAASGQDDNDWLFTGCLELTGGTSYTLDYWFKNFDLDAPCNIDTYVGSNQIATSMTQLLNQNPIPGDTSFQHSIISFTVPNTGVYYIGFHAFSSSGTGTSSIRLDDINLDNGNFIGINENAIFRNVNIFPNPGNGIFYLNSTTISKNINVDIFNINGQNVYSSQLNNLNQQRIDLSKQSNGVYTIRITSDSYVENHSIIVNR